MCFPRMTQNDRCYSQQGIAEICKMYHSSVRKSNFHFPFRVPATAPPDPFEKLAAPARRALNRAGITSVKLLSKVSERNVAGLHDMGPNAIGTLRAVLRANGLRFKRAHRIKKPGTPPGFPSAFAERRARQRNVSFEFTMFTEVTFRDSFSTTASFSRTSAASPDFTTLE